jgi:hypothetical protein
MSVHNVGIVVSTFSMVEIFNLEGIAIPLVYSINGHWEASIEDFNISGPLDVLLYCTGANGTPVELKLTVDDASPQILSGKIKKGYCIIQSAILL